MKETMKEMVGGCCVCSDERGWPDNPLVYCDGNGCTVAVHQACYGIIAVPTGPWYCRKCESPETKGKVRCELCPSKSGALKRSDTGGWAHVVCALYIPEVRFGNVTSMEPIVLRLIPPERFNKTCYICQDLGKTNRANAGACMQCNKSGCKQQFHVTCAQSLGLLCEEAGNYLDNVKYCGYCQHHYSKLKKGGNVKTIPPYKPVSHDSQSSDSSCEKEEASPLATGSSTPTHTTKAKGPGRKASHTSTVVSGKNTPNSLKTPGNTNQQTDKKKPSPNRRGSSAGDGGSKGSTPAPSPQHNMDTMQHITKAGGSTPAHILAKIPLPNSSPIAKIPESVGVISSVASATASSCLSAPLASHPSVSTSVVQVATKPIYQETVITNTEAVDTKMTKKRKAVTALNSQTVPIDYATTPGVISIDVNAQMWDNNHMTESSVDGMEKVIKKAKIDTSNISPASHFNVASVPPPPPPPAHSPATHPSPRHLLSPMPGPSGMIPVSNIRSPSHLHPSQAKEREGPASLLVSVPLPSTSHGLNLSAHLKIPTSIDMSQTSHIFHQVQKQAAMDPSLPGHSPLAVPGRSAWGGLNVTYEMQQDPNKPGVSGMAGPSKDPNINQMAPMPPAAIRNKKRAAMASAAMASAAMASSAMASSAMASSAMASSAMASSAMASSAMASSVMASSAMASSAAASSAAAMGIAPPLPPPQMQPVQSLVNVRRPPQPTPPPIYQETIKDSPPSSPSSERTLKPKPDTSRPGPSYAAPHMLGNELNPDSTVAARLQEQLAAELAAHAAGAPHLDPFVPPPLFNKAGPSTYARTPTSAQSLDQLLERQWEQGSQFLMEQAQHFDIASLLSCLHQLRTENVRLEEHVGSLLQRRDHLLAVNARLAIPLTAVSTGPPEPMRCTRVDSGSQIRAPPPPARTETITSDRSHQILMREAQQKPS